jgi:glycyl-tRNA synthetase beta chain/uncharacterized protein
MHHNIAKHDHLLRSVRLSFRLARLFGADPHICARAALIHDIDSRTGTLWNHGAIAARWAEQQGESDEVCTAIVSHMYPFGPTPLTREGWVLVIADKVASLGDFTQFVRGLADGSSIATRRRLRRSDPFYRHSRLRRVGHRILRRSLAR